MKKKTSPRRPKRPAVRPARQRSHIGRRDLQRYRVALLAERERLQRQCSFTDEVMEAPEAAGDLSQHRTHVADQGTENYQREMASRFKSIESMQGREINDALRRIADGTYGICAQCGGPIAKARLDIVPHARLCMKCLRPQRSR